jgi:C4-type Zn-finger protein
MRSPLEKLAMWVELDVDEEREPDPSEAANAVVEAISKGRKFTLAFEDQLVAVRLRVEQA